MNKRGLGNGSAKYVVVDIDDFQPYDAGRIPLAVLSTHDSCEGLFRRDNDIAPAKDIVALFMSRQLPVYSVGVLPVRLMRGPLEFFDDGAVNLLAVCNNENIVNMMDEYFITSRDPLTFGGHDFKAGSCEYAEKRDEPVFAKKRICLQPVRKRPVISDFVIHLTDVAEFRRNVCA